MDPKNQELAVYRMKEAEEALKSGKALIKVKDCRGALNRFYYAAFYGMQALLLKKGKDARTHSGNLYLFHEEFIRYGPLPHTMNKILTRLFQQRMEGDYGSFIEPKLPEAQGAAKDCELFLKEAKKIFAA